MVRIPDVIDPVEYLLDCRFPLGRFPNRLSPEQLVEKNVYRAELEALSVEELKARIETEQARQQQLAQAKIEREERDRFFNKVDAFANFAHWGKAKHWTLDEAVALSLGRNPDLVNWETVKSYTKISPFAEEYRKRRDLAHRAVPWKDLFDPILPGLFLSWAKGLEISYPLELEAAVTKYGGYVASYKSQYEKLVKLFDEQRALYDQAKQASEALSQALRSANETNATFITKISRLEAIVSQHEHENKVAQRPAFGYSTRYLEAMYCAIEKHWINYDKSHPPMQKQIRATIAEKLGVSVDSREVTELAKAIKPDSVSSV